MKEETASCWSGEKDKLRRRLQEDSGISQDLEATTPDDIFGPIVELNDEVFGEMFESNKSDNKMRESNNIYEKKTNEKKRLSLSMIKTTFSPIERRFSLGGSKRSSIRTNPNVSWKPKSPRKRVQVTEL